MPEEYKKLEAENKKLKEVLFNISKNIDEIKKIIEDNRELFDGGEEQNAPATEDEVKDLLKKYSRLHWIKKVFKFAVKVKRGTQENIYDKKELKIAFKENEVLKIIFKIKSTEYYIKIKNTVDYLKRSGYFKGCVEEIISNQD